ncbi:MAG: patatin-like phospholipase family protein [Candidatus Nanopelagicales bacterium]|jgi:NTE family protein|nr:patatin-like phospholipase family protein [Candidatus Nanopelagicales bacterium]
MLSQIVDIGRVGQYMRTGERVREALAGPREDLRFLDQLRRGLLPLPIDGAAPTTAPFPPFVERRNDALAGRRVAVIATGGSGALASVVGIVRALEEAGTRPVGYGVCSGSALFSVPLAAGLGTDEVAAFMGAMRPGDYLDPDWTALLTAPLQLARGWDGLLRGEALEASLRRLIGDVTLGGLVVPVWFPMWNIETNRLEYISSATHPDLPAAHAVRMAVALPLAVKPVPFDGGWWLDGGIVDILPSRPFLEGDLCDVAVVVNGFYGEGFVPDHAHGWRDRVLSILHVAGQTRLMHHIELTRRAIADLRRAVPDVIELTPVDYAKVHGAGLYGEFVDNRSWPAHMRAGHEAAAEAFARWAPSGAGGEEG